MGYQAGYQLVQDWKCAECGSNWVDPAHMTAGRASRSRRAYNTNQRVCSEKCARLRKTRLQRERRADARD